MWEINRIFLQINSLLYKVKSMPYYIYWLMRPLSNDDVILNCNSALRKKRKWTFIITYYKIDLIFYHRKDKNETSHLQVQKGEY